MYNCPLCSSKKNFVLNEYSYEVLKAAWQKSFEFNPFKNFSYNGNMYKLQCCNCQIIFYNPSFFGDDDFYPNISNNTWYYEGDKWEFDLTLKLIAKYKVGSLLEIGAGDGNFLKKVKYGIDDIEGIEINQNAIMKCIAQGLNVSAKSIDSFNRKFDLVASFQVFEHLDNPRKFIEKSLELLTDNGYFLISVPNPDGYLKEMHLNLLDLPPHHNLGWTKETFLFLSKQYDLDLIEYHLEPLRFVHYQSYVMELLRYDNELEKQTFKQKFLRQTKKLAFKVSGVGSYLSNRDKIIGQTHLALFKKNST